MSSKAETKSLLDHSREGYYPKQDIFLRLCLFSGAVIMVIWPWIVLAVTWGGLKMQGQVGIVAENSSQQVSFVVTFIAGVINLAMVYLFSRAVASLAEQQIIREDSTISHIAFFITLRNRSLPTFLFQQRKLLLFWTVVLYIVGFAFVTPGMTALLLPVRFTKSVSLNGTELDFASQDTDCVNWFNNSTFESAPGNTFFKYKGLMYESSFDDPGQLLNLLESGYGNVLSKLTDASFIYNRLVGVIGLYFLGSSRGVLPIGPNGVPGFPIDLDADLLSDPSHNYTLGLQGVSSNVSCVYDTQTPIMYSEPLEAVWQYNGTCPPGQNFLFTTSYISLASNYSLGSWMCQTSPSGNSYIVYLEGIKNYANTIGKITCNISPIQPAVFSVNYTGQLRAFSISGPIFSSPNTSTDLIASAMMGLGDTIWRAQGVAGNLVADSAVGFGIQSLDVLPDSQNATYLRIFEALIQGILDYETTYIRFLYAANVDSSPPAPQSCFRAVPFSAQFKVFGWHATFETAAFLVPMTIINLTSLVILAATYTGKRKRSPLDPTDPVDVILLYDETGEHLRAAMQGSDDPTPLKTHFHFRPDDWGSLRSRSPLLSSKS